MMNSQNLVPAYRPLDVALLRTTVHARELGCGAWPDHEDQNLDDAARVWRPWLVEVWSQPQVASAVKIASPTLATRLDALGVGAHFTARQIRRMAFALARYMVRMRGRATPFGLFAGIAAIRFGSSTSVEWGEEHWPVHRADAQWLAGIVARLEACSRLRQRLRVTANNLTEVRGQRLLVKAQPHATEAERRVAGEFSIRRIPAVRMVLGLASSPIFVSELNQKLACEYPNASRTEFDGLLAELIACGVLVSELRPPSTCMDGLGDVLARLGDIPADDLRDVGPVISQLCAIYRQLTSSSPPLFDDLRHRAVTERMIALSDAAEQPSTVDLRLGATALLPSAVADEAAAAAAALMRLSPAPSGVKAWREYHGTFLATYGPGTLVPVDQLISATAGLGFPRHFQEHQQAQPGMSGRDEQLLALAHQAAIGVTREIVLDAETLDVLAPPEEIKQAPPHVDVWFNLRAPTAASLDAGDFELAVCGIGRPGAGVGRFLDVLPSADRDRLAAGYRSLSTLVSGALPVQLSFPPRTLKAENVLRAPLVWPDVISLGEHHPEEQNRILMSDLAVTADQHRIHLVSMSRRCVLEPHIPHAAARHAMPLLARFLFELPSATGPAISSFNWGIAAHLPFLPRVRCGKTILSPAQWRLNPADLPGRETPQREWDTALAALRERRGIPSVISVGAADRQLRLHLDDPMELAVLRDHINAASTAVTMCEEATAADHGWLEGRAHEIVLPLAAAHTIKPPAVLASSAPLPVANGRHGATPGSDASVLNATIYGPPDAVDEILLDHLPDLWASWDEELPLWWFIRYRTPEPHLRLRIRQPDYGRAAERVGRWVQELRDARLVSRLSFDTYYPETGRFGPGEAMMKAEKLFAADSAAVLAQLTVHTRSRDVHPYAVTAVSMVDLACAVTGSRAAGAQWLLQHPHLDRHTPIRDRSMLRQAVHLAEESARCDLPSGSQLGETWQSRASVARAYTSGLTPETSHLRPESVLPSLLHLHHVRAHGIDPDAEALTHRLAHSIALSWNARREQETGRGHD